MTQLGSEYRDQLLLLSEAATLSKLRAHDIPWTEVDRQCCAALRTRLEYPQAPIIVGLLGGASSGKSTLFNSLLDREISEVSAHAHQTKGLVMGVHESRVDTVLQVANDSMLLGCNSFDRLARGCDTQGSLEQVAVATHEVDVLRDIILVDTPDVTTKMSHEEGGIATHVLPWFDLAIIVIDEERWFDAQVLEKTARSSAQLGSKRLFLFNQTASSAALSQAEQEKLLEHNTPQQGERHLISPYQSGHGYRPLSRDVTSSIKSWIAETSPALRSDALLQFLRTRAASAVQTNVLRSRSFDQMAKSVQEELTMRTSDTHLTTDLLSKEERSKLGLGYRLMPLYGALSGLSRRVSSIFGSTSRNTALSSIEFDKDINELSGILRENYQQRFIAASKAVEQLVRSSEYLIDAQELWEPSWQPPELDASMWAQRVRGHIDTWQKEASQQNKSSDLAALSVGVPLLLADLLFLGGAGMTLGWTAVGVVGMLSGKSAMKLIQKSPAFEEYQTTVYAYQQWLNESLQTQWKTQAAQMPQRHLPMNDPALRALMVWSTQQGAGHD